MTTLSFLQRHFQNYLQGKPSNIHPFISEETSELQNKRLEIYTETQKPILIKSLRHNFPKLSLLMGEEHFETTCVAYLQQFPSHYFSLRLLGKDLSRFLKQQDYYVNKPYFAEMAEFEWLLTMSKDATNVPCLNISHLQALSGDQLPTLRLTFHPSFAECYFEWNITELWQSLDADENNILEKNPLEKNPSYYWIWRQQNWDCQFHSCTELDSTAAAVFQNGGDFADLCARLSNKMPENAVPVFALNCLHQWFAAGIIAGIYF